MKSFQDIALPEALQHTLEHMKFTVPTPIQAQAIPLALEGKDILGSAQTGTGKTAAFGIPLITKLMNHPFGTGLVLTPTRELATQVMTQLQAMLGRKSKIKTALLIGGESMGRQLNQLRRQPRLIVGTPGRINDHLERGTLMLDETDFLVLDETDRMLDMGFSIQVKAILQHMPKERQTLLFSATLPKDIVKISNQYLKNPERVSVAASFSPAEKIKQDMIQVKESDKYPSLLSQLDDREGSIIVFVKTKYNTERMAKRLSQEGHSADAIHGDLRQNKRDRVLSAFRKKKYRILVATDVAARGLDIPHIEHVINYDMPQCPEDYIHRIGRTARAGMTGEALNLVAPADRGKWAAICRLLNPKAKGESQNKGRRHNPRKPGGYRGHSNGKSAAGKGAGRGGRKPGGKPAGKRFGGPKPGQKRRSNQGARTN